MCRPIPEYFLNFRFNKPGYPLMLLALISLAIHSCPLALISLAIRSCPLALISLAIHSCPLALINLAIHSCPLALISLAIHSRPHCKCMVSINKIGLFGVNRHIITKSLFAFYGVKQMCVIDYNYTNRSRVHDLKH